MRVHLFEFEDQTWFSIKVRNGMMDYLRFIFDKINIYKPALLLLAKVIHTVGCNKILDLCSGSGGDIVQLHRELETTTNKKISVLLSDKYPNIAAYREIEQQSAGHICFLDSPTEAATINIEQQYVRTMFSAFHHFDIKYAKQILQNAINSNAPIAIFDGGTKNILFLLAMLFVHPITLFAVAPFIRPFSFSRLFYTYVIPLIPLCTMWDGSISILRLYSEKDLQRLVADMHNDHYKWEVGNRKTSFGLKMNYLIGVPI